MDPDGDVIDLVAENLPSWLIFNAQNKAITGTPQTSDIGTYEITLTADDGAEKTVHKIKVNVDSGEQYDSLDALDFYSVDINNQERKLTSNIEGQFAAHVQFVQSHSIAASNNSQRDTSNELMSRYMPNLVPERAALMLVLPAQTLSKLTAILSVNGQVKSQMNLNHPNALPRSDYNATDGRADVIYSTKAWSIEIPWELMVPGLTIEFIADEGLDTEVRGSISKFDFSAPAELILRSIRLGMLTDAPNGTGYHMLNNSALAAADYFQTVPLAKLTLVNYQTIKLDKVIISDGTIYDQVSKSDGSVYGGDMRADVAKAQVSTGINLANVGITSNNMMQSYPHVFKHITMHHAAGNYANGIHSHGLSGGNGIATLYQSLGNELSHEIGHAYGLGHFPGAGLTSDSKWAAHHADSGWGYIAHRKRMRANLHWHSAATGANINGVISPYTYKNIYSYNRDAMSGGEIPTKSDFSVYTHHTGYSALLIQKNLDMPIPDTNFPSGYKKWDSTSLRFIDHPKLGDPRILKPVKVGVQVTTLLGGYDPVNGIALIYPTFEGNYGNIFDYPSPAQVGDACWLEVSNLNGELKTIAIAATRYSKNSINQFHVNLPASFLPTSAEIFCRKQNNTVKLASQVFSGVRAALPDAVIVGKEHGFEDLKKIELAKISSELDKLNGQTVPVPSPSLSILIASYSKDEILAKLSDSARQVFTSIDSNNILANTIKRLVNRVQLNGNNLDDRQMARQWLQDIGLVNSEGKIAVQSGLLMRTNASICVTSVLVDGKVTIQADCKTANLDLNWFIDGRGAIHPRNKIDKCLAPGAGDSIVLNDCDINNLHQRWTYDAGRLRNQGNNKCIDHGKGTVIMYGCHTSANQQWKQPISVTHPLFALLSGKTMRSIFSLLN